MTKKANDKASRPTPSLEDHCRRAETTARTSPATTRRLDHGTTTSATSPRSARAAKVQSDRAAEEIRLKASAAEREADFLKRQKKVQNQRVEVGGRAPACMLLLPFDTHDRHPLLLLSPSLDAFISLMLSLTCDQSIYSTHVHIW